MSKAKKLSHKDKIQIERYLTLDIRSDKIHLGVEYPSADETDSHVIINAFLDAIRDEAEKSGLEIVVSQSRLEEEPRTGAEGATVEPITKRQRLQRNRPMRNRPSQERVNAVENLDTR